jgi:LmbE family N-acetylglucosaminyl deacetylase
MRPADFPDEQTLVPYQASAFEARRVLVFAPHPDDETLGCGGALAELIDRGARLDVVLVSDGAHGARDAEDRARITTLRIEESRRALAALGGGANHRVHSEGLLDRSLSSRLADVEEILARWLVSATPDLVFAPSPVETHPDHRAVAAALVNLAARPERDTAVQALERATVAFFELSQPFRANFLVDITRVLDRKSKAVAAFVSQAESRDYAGFVLGLNAYRRMTLPPDVKAAEAYAVCAGSRLREAPRDVLAGLLPATIGVGGKASV